MYHVTLHICLTKSVLKQKRIKGFLICTVNIKIHNLGLDSTEKEEIWKQNGPKGMRASGADDRYLISAQWRAKRSRASAERMDCDVRAIVELLLLYERQKDGESTYPDNLWAGVVRRSVEEEKGNITRSQRKHSQQQQKEQKHENTQLSSSVCR